MKRIFIFIGFAVSLIGSPAHAISYLGINAEKNFAHWQFETPHGDNHFNFSGTNTGFFAGYGCILDPNFYLGGEIFANVLSINTSTEFVEDISYQAKAKYGFGFRFIAGHYIFPPAFIFISLGMIDTEFELDAIHPDGSKKDENDDALAIQYGFGIQSKIYKKLEARLEYIYSNYRSFNSFGNVVFPQNNQINFGLIYRVN